MNSWKLNGLAGHVCRSAIVKGLEIHHTEIYKEVKNIKSDGTIITRDGKEYILELKEVKNES